MTGAPTTLQLERNARASHQWPLLSAMMVMGCGIGWGIGGNSPIWLSLLLFAIAAFALIESASPQTAQNQGDATNTSATEENSLDPAAEPPGEDFTGPIPLPPPGERPDFVTAIGETDGAADWEARYAAAGRPVTTLEAGTISDPAVEAKVTAFLTKHPRGAVILRNARELTASAETALGRLAAGPGGPLIVLTLRFGSQAVATLLSAPAQERARRLAARFAEDGLPGLARLLGVCHVSPRRGLGAHTPTASKAAPFPTNTSQGKKTEGSASPQPPDAAAPIKPEQRHSSEEEAL